MSIEVVFCFVKYRQHNTHYVIYLRDNISKPRGAFLASEYSEANILSFDHWNGRTFVCYDYDTRYKVPLREVPRGVAQGHIIIPTGRNDHLFLHTKKRCPEK